MDEERLKIVEARLAAAEAQIRALEARVRSLDARNRPAIGPKPGTWTPAPPQRLLDRLNRCNCGEACRPGHCINVPA